jgi:mRNA interferase RelE/StbE
MVNETLLSEVSVGLAEVQAGAVYHCQFAQVIADLRKIWNPVCREVLKSKAEAAKMRPPTKRPPPWYLGWSSSFRKAVDKIDRTIQGRILEALSDIVENPLVVRGDRIKPLTGELKGCWRYRIGDFRLVYAADQSSGNITLLRFEARGSVYDD